MSEELKQRALAYHAEPRPGKTAIKITKPAQTGDDLTLAYSPGVAAPVREIHADEHAAYDYTNKGNLVGVISNGTAVLGLGKQGALASKPVMEGKAVLFKKFADIDVFDIELDTTDPHDFIETVARIAPTFGGINLEDIKAPECFEIECALIERLDIPVFHDDQHGTAIICAAGALNACHVQGKDISEAKIVCLGAGAAAISTMKTFVAVGAHKENIRMIDRSGVIHIGRMDLGEQKQMFALDTDERTLADAIEGADIFVGLSAANQLSPEMVARMADKPIIFAMANPDPEIRPEIAKQVRDDLIIATGRSDYPNQVNNVLGFPFIFRGALDVRARHINDAMAIAAVHALKLLAREPVPQEVLDAYGLAQMEFGPEYIVPTPFDPRLMEWVPPAVAKAAVETGVARIGYPAHYPPMDMIND